MKLNLNKIIGTDCLKLIPGLLELWIKDCHNNLIDPSKEEEN